MAPRTLAINEVMLRLQKKYNIIDEIDLDHYHTLDDMAADQWLQDTVAAVAKKNFRKMDRIVVYHNEKDYYKRNQVAGCLLTEFVRAVVNNKIPFHTVQILTNNLNIERELVSLCGKQERIADIPHTEGSFEHITLTDPEPVIVEETETELNEEVIVQPELDFIAEPVVKEVTPPKPETYAYGSAEPVKVALATLQKDHRTLLSESKTFCIYPWIHLHAWPTGQAFPCCHSEHTGQLGSTQRQSLDEIWNGKPMRELRTNMLSDTPTAACTRCYEQEASGFFSGRQSANKHHGHHIARVDATHPDGTLDEFKMTYWDIRFSNLCNLSCRSCGHIFSSSWFQDQAELAGPEWKSTHKPLNVAGRWETDMIEQLLPHLDYVEQIYFAGGEPLLMAEHYLILDELERRGRFDVRLIYNTNFTETSLKGRSVFDYWRKFESVAVGASLDAMGARAEYIRKGTKWQQVEFNRQRMMTDCPNVDFYISPTLSIMNAAHLPDFHRTWVEKGLIKPQDLNVNILQDPPYLRIDIADEQYKEQLTSKYEQHIEWLKPLDHLRRATVGFESAINFLNSSDKSDLLPEFWARTGQLDNIRNENVLQVLPELNALKK